MNSPPIFPGEGWRLLKEGEAIQTGDEYLSWETGAWSPTSFAVGALFLPSRHPPMKRKEKEGG